MRVKEMDDRIGTQMAVLSDGVLWTPESSRAFRQPPAPVIPGLFDQAQGRYLEDFPMLCAVRNRLNAVLARVTEARASFERELIR